jgi:hypothetical protein
MELAMQPLHSAREIGEVGFLDLKVTRISRSIIGVLVYSTRREILALPSSGLGDCAESGRPASTQHQVIEHETSNAVSMMPKKIYKVLFD